MEWLKRMASIARLTDETAASEEAVRIEKNWNGNLLQTTVTNISGEPLSIKEVVLFAGEWPYSPDTPFYGEGYQMLTQYAGTLESPYSIGEYGADWDFFRLPRTGGERGLWTTYNLLELFPEGAGSVLMGFASCWRFSGEFRFCSDYVEAVMDTEGLLLGPGECWELESFLAASGTDRDALYEELAATIQASHPTPRYKEIPTGWCSFYCLRPLTANMLYENARALAERVPQLGRIQIDAGYEGENGDVLITKAAFGADDMKTVCDTIREAGAEPAGYFSPFIVGRNSEVFKLHPDWLVRDEAGNPNAEVGANPDWFMLDGSHPEVQRYLKNIARVMHDEWGVRYIKLDFLSYGALPGGRRYNPELTRVEAYRLGVKAIVEGVGNDCFILGCNAAFWPSLGLFHGNRVTNDTFRTWKVVDGNAQELFGRNWQNNALWINDPDVLVMEKLDLINDDNGQWDYATLTEDEFEYHKAFIVASGGMILSGDPLTTMPEERMRMLKKLLPPIGVAARFDDRSHTIGRIDLGDRLLLCLFNREEEEKELAVSLEGKYRVFDFWTDEELGVFAGMLPLKLRPHYARVLVLRPVEHGTTNSLMEVNYEPA
ncbi:glycoside hydrolase family 36 protein [Cohnella silvisoli]|uniref:Alpha-galactosidase n=1 Tax=Cohnella silvisoli TaxID=2873699 RepID=A0ABV1L6E8_9BACL|nr:glycoside hydrolase family 36 protein [Cohnella silvisoli]MCD9026419.1 alpha-galactosidase [Cohnella silvisoli]